MFMLDGLMVCAFFPYSVCLDGLEGMKDGDRG